MYFPLQPLAQNIDSLFKRTLPSLTIPDKFSYLGQGIDIKPAIRLLDSLGWKGMILPVQEKNTCAKCLLNAENIPYISIDYPTLDQQLFINQLNTHFYQSLPAHFRKKYEKNINQKDTCFDVEWTRRVIISPKILNDTTVLLKLNYPVLEKLFESNHDKLFVILYGVYPGAPEIKKSLEDLNANGIQVRCTPGKPLYVRHKPDLTKVPDMPEKCWCKQVSDYPASYTLVILP
jgi:hypothetical protein